MTLYREWDTSVTLPKCGYRGAIPPALGLSSRTAFSGNVFGAPFGTNPPASLPLAESRTTDQGTDVKLSQKSRDGYCSKGGQS